MSYKEALIEAGLDPDDYGDMEGKLPYQNQFKRDHVYRSKAENERYVLDLVVRAGEMLNPNHAIYMCDDRIRCAQCAFRELCIEDLKGRDMQHIIDAQFIKNTDQYKGE